VAFENISETTVVPPVGGFARATVAGETAVIDNATSPATAAHATTPRPNTTHRRHFTQ
jgi:hypothetical protein